MMPSPQKPPSIRQLPSQPSLLLVFPSSHSSEHSRLPLPQMFRHPSKEEEEEVEEDASDEESEEG